MLEYIGKYNKGTILIDTVEENVVTQLYSILNHPAFANSNIAIMPDCHIGNGAMVGFTMSMNEYVVPSVIGVDIGCGITAYNLGHLTTKSEKLDNFIRKNIPSGAGVHDKSLIEPTFIKQLIKNLDLNEGHVMCSLGSLGGGNHFIELDKDEHNNIWLVIHSGSRNLGLQVAYYHQAKAKELMKEIYNGSSAYFGLEYLPIDQGGQQYIEDMVATQKYASLNRELMAKLIIEKFYKLRIDKLEKIESVHNYIDLQNKIVRKGAISAQEGEKVIIPLNRAYGCLIGTGKSGAEYNYSAPHGAGRIMNRGEAKHKVSLEAYQKSMKGIFTTTVSKRTLDESPMVYKRPKFIIENVSNLIDIEQTIKPVYSFKADE
jgi:RNA-splicing ligase RtcB